MPTWIERLNNGLDSMWGFLRFHPEKPSVHDIEVLESYLDDLRTMMVQKNGGQEQYTAKTAGAIDFGDLEMTINSIVMQAMWIYLGHGFEKIDDLMFEHRRELAEKDKTIAYYRKIAEKATDRKQRAIRDNERRAKLNFSYAVLIIAGMAVIPWLLWLIDTALKSFWLWAN